MSASPTFSIIVPTRGRLDGLRRLLASFRATTKDINRIEVVLVMDEDDDATIRFEYAGVPLKRVIVRPGLSMGSLNMAGYEVASGRYIMLLNDDVIVRTPAWDEGILAAFRSAADEIVLVHVNDKIFEDRLCTFPFLSKTYCEVAGGICPKDYIRYRIDDHIYNVFNLLSVLGRTRILYLPDVVFEHTNYVLTATGHVEYRPDPVIHEKDTKTFDSLLPQRKEIAVRLAGIIDQHLQSNVANLRKALLDPVMDSVALRLPEYSRIWSDNTSLSSENTRVTIGIVSANLRCDHARLCIDRVKKHTRNFDLIVLDNNRGPNFNHSREINRIISICKTDYLILMDDDVFVEPGWLDGMLRCIDLSVGVVTPLHKDSSGKLSYAGVVMRPDYSGHHTHCLDAPESGSPIQTLCSAITLIDLGKCGHLHFDETYNKYFLDIDFGLRVWEAGFSVVCSPYTIVTHLGGATVQQGGDLSKVLFEQQRQNFVRAWIKTKRYTKLEREVWGKVPAIQTILGVPSELDSLLIRNPAEGVDDFRRRAQAFFVRLRHYPVLLDYSRQRICDSIGGERPTVDESELGHLGLLLDICDTAIFIRPNCDDLALSHPEPKLVQATRRALRILRGGLQMLQHEQKRFGSWKPALLPVSYVTLKRLIISLWGHETFDRLETKWRAMRIRTPDRRLALQVPQFFLAVLFKALTSTIRRTGDPPLS